MPTSSTQHHTCTFNRAAFGGRSGFSLVELLCVLAVIAVLLGGAVQLFNDLRQGQRLQAAASLLETDIHFARSSAITTGSPVRLVTQALQSGGSCYLLHTGAANACECIGQVEARCNDEARLLRIEVLPPAGGVTLTALSYPLVFDGRKATVTPTATLRLASRDGRAIHQVVNIMGRVRSCSPAGSVGGLRTCS